MTWKTGARGVTLQPLTGFATLIGPMTIGLLLEYAESDEQLLTGTTATLQVAMTATIARELATELLLLADAVEAQPKGTRQ